MNRVYLDHAATTDVLPAAIDAMVQQMRAGGNPSSLHATGRDARATVEYARERIARAIGCDAAEVIFTSGGTEADNLAVKGMYWKRREADPVRRRILVSSIEHHAVEETCEWLQKTEGAVIDWIPVDSQGLVDPESVRELIAQNPADVALVTVMWANNEVGTVQPIQDIAAIASEYGIPMHTDAVQAFGQIPLSFSEMGIDLLSASAHKLHGPKGIGLLVIRKGVRLPAFLHGGAQERGFRAGTENVPGIVGFAKAAEEAFAGMSEREKRKRELQKLFFRRLLEEVPGIKITGVNPLEASGEKRLSGNVHICIEGIEAESLLLLLDQKGICASAGSACASGSVEPSHVLLALGKSHVEAYSGLRLSFEEDLKEEELEFTVKAIREGVERLRKE